MQTAIPNVFMAEIRYDDDSDIFYKPKPRPRLGRNKARFFGVYVKPSNRKLFESLGLSELSPYNNLGKRYYRPISFSVYDNSKSLRLSNHSLPLQEKWSSEEKLRLTECDKVIGEFDFWICERISEEERTGRDRKDQYLIEFHRRLVLKAYSIIMKTTTHETRPKCLGWLGNYVGYANKGRFCFTLNQDEVEKLKNIINNPLVQ